MKLIGLALIACLLACYPVTTTANPTCANHPIFTMAQSFLKRVVAEHEVATKVMEQFLSEFSNATPKELTADELGVCSQYAGQQTCCSQAMTGFFDKVATLTGAVVQQAGNPITKFILLVKKILVTHGCSTKLESMSAEDILSNPANPKIKTLFDAIQQSKLAFSKVVAGMNRGSLCSICVGVEEVNDFISSDKVYILASSLDQFFTDLFDSWNYISTFFYNESMLSLALKEAFSVYGTESCPAGYQNTFIASFSQNFFTLAFTPENTGSESGYKCSGLVLFNERPLCETSQDSVTGIDAVIENYTETPLRILPPAATEDVEDGVSAGFSTTGVWMYLPSQMDYKITEAGEAMVSFSDYYTKEESTSTFISRLSFGVLLAVFSLFVL